MALIGRAVGDGDGVGASVAVGLAVAASEDGEAVGDAVAVPHAETTIARPSARWRVWTS